MIVVGSTMARYTCDRPETSLSWLNNAEEMQELSPEPLEFFAALELDGDGRGAFLDVARRLNELGGTAYEFVYQDWKFTKTTESRLNHICMGRNVITDYAMDIGASHILFLDADMEPPADAVARLLELQWPMVGGHVPTYNLYGERVRNGGDHANPERIARTVRGETLFGTIYPEEWDVQTHMNTAGFLLVARQVFSRIRWRHSPEDGMTDDPCYEQDAREFLGYPTYVRHSVVGRHFPESILPIEHRFPERDMSVKP